jgi:hypothetical protein
MKFLIALMCICALAFATENPYAQGNVSGTFTSTLTAPEIRTAGVSITTPWDWLGKAYAGFATGWQDVGAPENLTSDAFYAGYQFISPEAFSPYVCLETGITSVNPSTVGPDPDDQFYFGQSLGFLQYVGDFSIDGSLGHTQVFEDKDIHSWTLGTEIGYSWWIPQVSSSIGLTCIFGKDVQEEQVISISPMTFSF